MNLALVRHLRSALASKTSEPPLTGDYPELRAQAAIPAAVLIAITDRAEPTVILTVRHENLRTHAGQIAFPGGRIEAGEEPVEAALREASEELGISPADVTFVGTLGDYRTVTGYSITPVIAVVPGGIELEPHDAEVAGWFEAPLDYVLDPANRRLVSAVFDGRERHYWEIVWQGQRIWGATAAILVNLSRRLQWKNG